MSAVIPSTAEKAHRELLLEIIKEGTLGVAQDYYMRLADMEQVSVDDLRKAMEFGAKAMGMLNEKPTDNLPQVTWVINGGNVTVAVEAAQPTIDMGEVTDVSVKSSPFGASASTEFSTAPTEALPPPTPELSTGEGPRPPAASLTPEAALAATFDVVDNLLDTI